MSLKRLLSAFVLKVRFAALFRLVNPRPLQFATVILASIRPFCPGAPLLRARPLLATGAQWVLLTLVVFWAEPATAAKIACVGDSITYGYGLSNPSAQSYPAVLQTLMGSDHTVENFGVSGATLLKQGDRPYWQESRFSDSDTFAPDVVVIMLGTNDAKPQNWTHSAEFSPDYEELIDHYRTQGALVYVATPPPVYEPGAFEISPSVVADEVVPLVEQIATQTGAPLIEVFQALSNHGDLFPDTVHPNAEGAQLLAEAVAAALMAYGLQEVNTTSSDAGADVQSNAGTGGNAAAETGGTDEASGGTGGVSSAMAGASATSPSGGAGSNQQPVGLGDAGGSAPTGATPNATGGTGNSSSQAGVSGVPANVNSNPTGGPAMGDSAQQASGGSTPSGSANMIDGTAASAALASPRGGSSSMTDNAGSGAGCHVGHGRASWLTPLLSLALGLAMRRRRRNGAPIRQRIG